MPEYRQAENMLTTGEVARIFRRHVNTVRRWSERGVLKAYRIGPRGRRRFRREDAAALLLEQAVRRNREG